MTEAKQPTKPLIDEPPLAYARLVCPCQLHHTINDGRTVKCKCGRSYSFNVYDRLVTMSMSSDPGQPRKSYPLEVRFEH